MLVIFYSVPTSIKTNDLPTYQYIFMLLFSTGLSTGFVTGEPVVNLDRRCRYKFKLNLQGQPDLTESIRIDSVVLFPALNYDAIGKSFAEYKHGGKTITLK